MARRQKLGAADVAWLRMESPVNPMTIVGIIGFEEPMKLEDLKRLVEERLLIFERFRQRVVYKGPTAMWETDPHFDIDAHVHRAGLAEPNSKTSLEELVSELMSTPLDFSKSPWQFHLVESFDGGSALIGRLHHSIGDGIALIHVLLAMADEMFDPARATPAYGRDRTGESLTGRLFRRAGTAIDGLGRAAAGAITTGLGAVQRPGKALEWARQGMSMGAAASKIALMSSDSDTRFKAPATVVKRVAWSVPLPLGAVKAIAHGAGGKLNDVLMAAVTGALRRYLAGHGEPTAGVEIRSAIPVNLRPYERAFDLGNVFGLVFLSLPVGIAGARERLMEIKRQMDIIKSSAEPAVAYGILQTIGAGPALLHEQVVEVLSSKVSAVVTNVPGPRECLHFYGNEIRRIMFWVPRAGDIGLGVSVMSYAGTVMLGIATDAKMAPDPEALVAAFHNEIDALTAEFGT
ncbi:MAG: wax ester/triacylglycerol synthase family O-acyltransferase [Bacteroidota bacterium]